MKHIELLSVVSGMFLSVLAAQAAEDAKSAPAPPPKTITVEIHGFAEIDMMTDDTRSFTEIVGNGAVVPKGSLLGNNGWTQFGFRNSRLSFLAAAPEMDGWKTKGYLESDFLG